MMVREKVTLEKRGQGVVAVLSFDVREAFGRARPPVRVTVNGETLRTTIAVYGAQSFVGFNAEFRAVAKIEAGDEVTLKIELDDEPRTVELPDELIEALGADERAFFDTLSYTHRREYAEWISSAVKAETRTRRAQRAKQMLGDHQQSPM
jgi:Bacteriocin-protection, YdeI or OmpD-Associated/Domain of unknown function (DUF1905)